MKKEFLELIEAANNERVSDIHVIMNEDMYEVRFRTKSKKLETYKILEGEQARRLINYIKFISEMNISEYRVQTGKCYITINGQRIDLRISSAPSIYFESIVIRIVQNELKYDITSLSSDINIIPRLQNFVEEEYGLILISGATGAGKTTTLYALIYELLKQSKSIITIEDPIEHTIPGVTQIQLNETAGFTYESIFKQVLRHDPDVIIFGEIRDASAAKMAIRSALTGHLVISTIHSNDAFYALKRFSDFDIADEDVKSIIKGVSHQKLVLSKRFEKTAVFTFISGDKIFNYSRNFVKVPSASKEDNGLKIADVKTDYEV